MGLVLGGSALAMSSGGSAAISAMAAGGLGGVVGNEGRGHTTKCNKEAMETRTYWEDR